jgi:CDP-glucose 4,6-dehydratase
LRLACDKAHNVLGWRPVFSAEEAIARTAGWYRKVCLQRGNSRAACRRDIRAYEHAAAYLSGKTLAKAMAKKTRGKR